MSPKAVIKAANGSISLRNEAISTNEAEINLMVVPYFFSSATKLKIKWYKDNEYQSGGASLIVKKEEGKDNSLIKALVTDPSDSLIRTIGQIKINFLGI